MKKAPASQRITVPEILQRKISGTKISALTAYDYTMARLIDVAGIDLILVGDSLGTVIQGNATTLPVSLDHMVYHCQCVTKGVENALVIGDLPFMTYQASIEQALLSSGRLIKEGGVSAVKLEGGVNVLDTIEALVRYDIPVVGHIGLTPQSYHRMGGYRIQGKKSRDKSMTNAGSREQILEDARAVEDAGAFALVLEGIPASLAREITDSLAIPTIGIGAGPHCDGQILVTQDMLGMSLEFNPRFVKRYMDLSDGIVTAIKNYMTEIASGEFPAPEHYFEDKDSKDRLKIV